MIRKLLQSSLVRFLLGGGITVVCEYVVFYCFYEFVGWNLLLANSLSFIVGLGVSFGFNRLWAFKKESFHRPAHHQIVLYALLAITNLLLNNGIVAGLKAMGLDPRIGKLVAIVLIAVWNFVIYRKIIFIGDSARLDQA